jgi:hypothetical protein
MLAKGTKIKFDARKFRKKVAKKFLAIRNFWRKKTSQIHTNTHTHLICKYLRQKILKETDGENAINFFCNT